MTRRDTERQHRLTYKLAILFAFSYFYSVTMTQIYPKRYRKIVAILPFVKKSSMFRASLSLFSTLFLYVCFPIAKHGSWHLNCKSQKMVRWVDIFFFFFQGDARPRDLVTRGGFLHDVKHNGFYSPRTPNIFTAMHRR